MSPPTYSGMSCKSFHTFSRDVANRQEPSPPMKNRIKVLCIAKRHEFLHCCFSSHQSIYVSDPSTHPSSKYHYIRVAWIMFWSLQFISRKTPAAASLAATCEAGTGCQAGHYCQTMAGHTGTDVVNVCRYVMQRQVIRITHIYSCINRNRFFRTLILCSLTCLIISTAM